MRCASIVRAFLPLDRRSPPSVEGGYPTVRNYGVFVVFPHPVDDRRGRRRTKGNQTPT
jgi:hypothetical protein